MILRHSTRLSSLATKSAVYMPSENDVLVDLSQSEKAPTCCERALAPPTRRPGVGDRFPEWTSSVPVVLTVVTFVAMIAGLLVSWRTDADIVAWVLYAIAYLAGGVIGVRSSIRSLRQGVIDIDLLMILAAIGALVIGAPFEGAMLLFLFSLSNVLQSFAMGRTRRAIESIMELRPDAAAVLRDGREVVLPLEDIYPGDVIRIRPGARVALDGRIVSGTSLLDQSSVTGESVPVVRSEGNTVFSGTINLEGSLDVEVTAHASESTIARLIALVEKAQKEKAKTQRFIEKAEQRYAAAVLVLTAVAIAFPIFILMEAFDSAFYRAMTLMVAASPCALVISTPATVLSAIGNGARRGILFKGGAYVEQAAAIKVIAFDKTGTLTEGHPRLTDIVPLDGETSKDVLLGIAAGIQHRSEHHLAAATIRAAAERDITFDEAASFRAEPGRGVEGVVDGRHIRIGNLGYLNNGALRSDHRNILRNLEEEGKTAVLMTDRQEGRDVPIAVFAFKDSLRAGVSDALHALREAGIDRIVMLTGDNEGVAKAIAAEAGVDEYYAGLLPHEKVEQVALLEARYGKIAMVGDGVNDAPALASASLGIAMGAAGTDVALETADIVLMADDLSKLPYLIALSRATRRTLVANLSFALAVILFMVATILLFGMPLPLAVIGHEGSTVLVSLNGIRLLGFRHRSGHRPPRTRGPAASTTPASATETQTPRSR
jgi:Zn2+/Cd2+-exporting ATPase